MDVVKGRKTESTATDSTVRLTTKDGKSFTRERFLSDLKKAAGRQVTDSASKKTK